jgi:exonuclease III
LATSATARTHKEDELNVLGRRIDHTLVGRRRANRLQKNGVLAHIGQRHAVT